MRERYDSGTEWQIWITQMALPSSRKYAIKYLKAFVWGRLAGMNTTYGNTHCCICARVCGHVGGPWYCQQHDPRGFAGMPQSYAPMGYGWVCPLCRTVYSPTATKCECAAARGEQTVVSVVSDNLRDFNATHVFTEYGTITLGGDGEQ